MNNKTMAERVEAYLAYRHTLGYQLHKEGQRLRSFARFADAAGYQGPLTTEIALRWARLPKQAARHYQARRLSVVRTLARYLAAREPGTEIPPRHLLGPTQSRRTPFIYSEADIAALLQAARALEPASDLGRGTYATLLGLLACTGLRIGEALAMRHDDVNWSTAVLTIRASKFRKPRLVPVHATAIEPLRNYALVRDRHHPPLREGAFFLSDRGRPLRYESVRQTFRALLRQAMPTVTSAGRTRPRLHDLRHTVAVRCVLGWYRQGIDIHRVIDQLAAYLGHTKVSCTYWYLTGVPELFALAAERFESFAAAVLEVTDDTDL